MQPNIARHVESFHVQKRPVMSNADKTTIRLRAYSDQARDVVVQSNLTEEQEKSLELVKKKTQLEEEKRKSLEQLKIIEQLRESLKYEQAKTEEIAKKAAELEVKLNAQAELEAKVKELSEVLEKISGIAASGKAP